MRLPLLVLTVARVPCDGSVGGQDVRPGLQFRREAERQHRLEQRRQLADERRRAASRPAHLVEAEHRERALDKVRRDSLVSGTSVRLVPRATKRVATHSYQHIPDHMLGV